MRLLQNEDQLCMLLHLCRHPLLQHLSIHDPCILGTLNKSSQINLEYCIHYSVTSVEEFMEEYAELSMQNALINNK